MKEIVLSSSNITKSYGGMLAVDHVNMTVKKGDIYGFIGQNGAGKTTMFRLVSSLIRPTSGGLSLFGESRGAGLEQAHKRMGCMVEGPVFHPKLTAAQNLEYYRIQRGIPDKKVIQEALETVRLGDTGKKKYAQFSLGMKQRLGLALAIMGNPDFLMLDEPINGLDPMGIVEMRHILKTLNQEHGMTILISSHILTELAQVATTFGIIHGGRLLQEISKEQLEAETRRSLSVIVEDTAAATVILENSLGSRCYEVLPGNEIRIYDLLGQMPEVTFQLSSGGVRVHSANELGVNLEEYFLQSIGQGVSRP